MKAIVETKGSFMLQDGLGQEVPHNRPACVEMNHFLTQREAVGQLKVILADLTPEATDKEWAEVLAESKDLTQAIAFFSDSYSESDEDESKQSETKEPETKEPETSSAEGETPAAKTNTRKTSTKAK